MNARKISCSGSADRLYGWPDRCPLGRGGQSRATRAGIDAMAIELGIVCPSQAGLSYPRPVSRHLASVVAISLRSTLHRKVQEATTSSAHSEVAAAVEFLKQFKSAKLQQRTSLQEKCWSATLSQKESLECPQFLVPLARQWEMAQKRP